MTVNEKLLGLLREAALTDPVALSGGEMLHEVNLAHPGLAEALYALNNSKNRPVGVNNSAKIRRSLAEGKWMFDGSPLRVNSNGVLDDGQHRTREVSIADLPAGVELRALVLTDMAPEAMLLYDINRPRTHGNAMAMAGIKNSTIAASVTRVLVAYEKETWPGSMREGSDSNEEAVADYLRLNSGGLLERSVSRAIECYSVNRASSTPRVFGSAYYILSSLNLELTDIFFDQLAQKSSQSVQVAKLISTLSARYMAAGEKVQSRKNKGTDDEVVISLALVIKTWNDWVRGKTDRSQLKFGLKVESFPYPLSGD